MDNEMMEEDFFSTSTWDDVIKRKKRLLVKYGFIKPNSSGEYVGKTSREMDKLVAKMDDKKVNSLAECEVVEMTKDWFTESGYPKSLGRNRLIYETTNDPIEEGYFFEKDMIQFDFWFHKFYKVTDSFAATEHSSLWGVSEQRIGLQQDKASQFLRGISEMIKAMFQIVRELRIIDERLDYYVDSDDEDSKTKKTSDYTLKGVYIDQVEGGSKNPASVYGLANTVGFSVLPDIFFRTHVIDKNLLDEQIEKLPFNEKVKEVLGRKLRQFLEWKKRTKKELQQRKKFTVKYLKQHYETVKLYISWIKPYLRNIERLQLDREKQDSADMVTSFDV